MRHGQSEWNAVGRHQGQSESRLTARGRDQARAMGAVLSADLAGRTGFAAFTSPQIRAAETAEIALAPLGLAAVADPRLKEISFGAWEGLTSAEISAGWPGSEARFQRDPFGWNFTSPGGEQMAEMQARLGAFLDDLTGPAVVIGHGIALRVLRGLWLGLDQAGMAALPGGQGVVWHLSDAGHRVLD